MSLLANNSVLGLFFLATASIVSAGPTLAVEPDAVRQKELVHLVRQDCGSCHGMTLKGGLGPALLPETLRDKPAEGLAATIYYGRPGTPMPPWKQFMSEAEAAWIVDKLMTEFPQ
ncbi:cytochrome c [Ferribacterium limneticum]|nr:cytochrome c [Ferribacterium limneticum]UCV33312.1 cytochrome c [Ferribacterium limneticum]